MNNPKTLFTCAHYGIQSGWGEPTIELPEITTSLQEKCASFVTLKIGNDIRGSIGSYTAYRELWKDVESNGYHAAFHDHRFSPLSRDEYEHISIEIALLTPPERIYFESVDDLRNIIRPGIDGIFFHCHDRHSTFLPKVWSKFPHFNSFFSHLSAKAGLGPEPDFENAIIERYQVTEYTE